MKWDRTSPDVEGAKIECAIQITGLPYARRAQYLLDIRTALAALPGWGGGDY